MYRPAVTSHVPYSGRTDAAGVTGALVYAGANPGFALDNLQGKIALIDRPVNARKFAELFQTWGVHPSGEQFPVETRPARGPVGDLTPSRKPARWPSSSRGPTSPTKTRPTSYAPVLAAAAEHSRRIRRA